MPADTKYAERMPTAHSLEEAARSDNSLEGYAAINHTSGPHHDQPLSEHEEIARLAYQLYMERNGEAGSAEEDWFRAERELRARRGTENRPTVPGDAMNL